VVPSASYAPPPDVTAAPPPVVNDNTGLPRSNAFWVGVDEPPDKSPQQAQLKETPRSSDEKDKQGKGAAQAGLAGKGQKKSSQDSIPLQQESPFGPPGRSTAKGKKPQEKALEKDIFSPFAAPKKGGGKEKGLVQKEEAFPIEERLGKEALNKGKGPASPFASPEKGGTKSEEKIAATTPSREKEVQAAPLQSDEREGGRGRERGKRFVDIEAPSLNPLPGHIIPIAQAAAAQATPYLSAQVIALFYQMVGTIAMMASQGISTTDVVLDSPSFANSIFFGSTITIEKYATAPDALYIRLTGSAEAVRTFNQNIPSLYAAFQHGNFKFRIGRIDASYTLERPVFRRKESGKEKGDLGGDIGERRK
jgi:hypothetical protein